MRRASRTLDCVNGHSGAFCQHTYMRQVCPSSSSSVSVSRMRTDVAEGSKLKSAAHSRKRRVSRKQRAMSIASIVRLVPFSHPSISLEYEKGPTPQHSSRLEQLL